MLTLDLHFEIEALDKHRQEHVKRTIFEADQIIALAESFMVAAGTITARATVHTRDYYF